MDVLDKFLQKVCDGMTPEMISVKVGDYRKEFETLKDDYRAELETTDDSEWKDANEEEDLEKELDETVFRGFVMHKLAALETVLGKIVKMIEEENLD
jgi:hypothetical protein